MKQHIFQSVKNFHHIYLLVDKMNRGYSHGLVYHENYISKLNQFLLYVLSSRTLKRLQRIAEESSLDLHHEATRWFNTN